MDLVGKTIKKVTKLPTIETAQLKDQKIETLILEFEDGTKLKVEPGEYCTLWDENGEHYHLNIQQS